MRVVAIALLSIAVSCAPPLGGPIVSRTAPPASSGSQPAPSPDDRPSPRAGAELVWHDRLRTLLLLNGTAHAGDKEEIWSWNGSRWQLVQRGGPERRDMGLVAYDGRRDRVVIFGGRNDTKTFVDTWEWDGTAWTERTDRPGDASNHLHGTYDVRSGLVLFGSASDARQRLLTQSWGLDAGGWHRLGPAATPARAHYAIAYDAERARTVMFGGFDGAKDLADVWEWDGTAWSAVSIAGGPSARAGARLAYDAASRRLVLFGGGNGRSNTDTRTYAYDGTSWSTIASDGPSGRGYGAMGYDPVRGRVVYFGGYDGARDLGDTWEFDGVRWMKVDG